VWPTAHACLPCRLDLVLHGLRVLVLYCSDSPDNQGKIPNIFFTLMLTIVSRSLCQVSISSVNRFPSTSCINLVSSKSVRFLNLFQAPTTFVVCIVVVPILDCILSFAHPPSPQLSTYCNLLPSRSHRDSLAFQIVRRIMWNQRMFLDTRIAGPPSNGLVSTFMPTHLILS
jgi:hypothetical protein